MCPTSADGKQTKRGQEQAIADVERERQRAEARRRAKQEEDLIGLQQHAKDLLAEEKKVLEHNRQAEAEGRKFVREHAAKQAAREKR